MNQKQNGPGPCMCAPAPDAIKKREATLAAECALVGVTLIPSTDERGRRVYIVSRWALTKELPDLDAVEAWLGRVRGRAA
ncbi:hypothetical protein [Variovorax sp. PBL-E5]|uniref:hypothetical protein n=1 Tax=Variovorax sp. PBL-E5 TaxID=434014 RepID=UPI0013198353|nr:hypothetical protein [Variovorax sp. PBL-E5]VTU36241.1 hypothetical protein E5CHR_04264 [Variovorax sp. PBL-E5]